MSLENKWFSKETGALWFKQYRGLFAIIESMNNLIKSKQELLPTSPGCHIHKDKNGTIIYVGAANEIKRLLDRIFPFRKCTNPPFKVCF